MKKLLGYTSLLLACTGCDFTHTIRSWFGSPSKSVAVHTESGSAKPAAVADVAVATNSSSEVASTSPVLVRINGKAVGTVEDFMLFAAQAIQMHPYLAQLGMTSFESLPNELREQFVDVFVKQKVVEMWGAQNKLTETEEYKTAYARALTEISRALVLQQFEKGVLADVSVSDSAVRTEYEQNKMRYMQMPESTSIVGAKFTDKEAAKAFFDRVKSVKDMKNFDAQVAEAKGEVLDLGTFSQDPRVPGGKDLTTEMRKALFQSKKEDGKFVLVEEGTLSWVLFKKEEKAAQYYPFEQVANHVKEQLLRKRYGEVYEERVAKLRSGMTVDVDMAAVKAQPAQPLSAESAAGLAEQGLDDMRDELTSTLVAPVISESASA